MRNKPRRKIKKATKKNRKKKGAGGLNDDGEWAPVAQTIYVHSRYTGCAVQCSAVQCKCAMHGYDGREGDAGLIRFANILYYDCAR